MGCNNSRSALQRPHSFKASNLNENDKSVRLVRLEVESAMVSVQTRSGKQMASWPMGCIRKYGFHESGILFIETGNGCDTGQGMYLFKCERSEEIFDLLKQHWSRLQEQQTSSLVRGAHVVQSMPLQTTVTSTSSDQLYVNNQPTASHGTDYVNGGAQTSSPVRGSTSSQHGGPLPSLPEEALLLPNPFPLQPAPTSRKEMITRRRINSETPTASYNRTTDRATVAMRPNSANYENSDVTDSLRVSYKKTTDEVTLGDLPKSGGAESSLVSPSSVSASVISLRSDCDQLLTPNSKSSGVCSLNGGAPVKKKPPPIPPPLNDPWKQRFPIKFKPPFSSGPQSARDYVNTANASRDVAGTPLPATAIGVKHFNFDFDLNLLRRPSSADRDRLNYVPVEVGFSCGASSTSSGIPGTPLRTPKTPKSSLPPSTEYAMIDHNKTHALFNALSTRQRDRKSRHKSTAEVST